MITLVLKLMLTGQRQRQIVLMFPLNRWLTLLR
nr:MAG TPA: hypothetical protein [Caudoviricetes sp.]